MKILATAVAVVAAIALFASGVSASEGGIGGGSDTPTDWDGAAESSATVVHDVEAPAGPGYANPFVAVVDADLTAVVGGAPAEPPCLEMIFLFTGVDDNGISVGTTECAARLICGYERVDDPMSGRFSGTAGGGRFAQYLSELGSATGPIAGDSPGAGDDIASVVLTAGLGNPPDDEAMPVMRWCARDTTGELVILDDTWGVGFSWDLTDIDDNYPIDAVRQSLVDEVIARVYLHEPTVETVPPFESGRTFVKFPTWLSVQDPLESIYRYAVNDRETVRVEIRAVLVDVVFSFDDDEMTCRVEDMASYDPASDDPVVDAPACSTVFLTAGDRAFGASLRYVIEERIAFSANRSFPAEPWVAHPTQPVVERDASFGDFGVSELYSLGISEDR